MIAHRWFTIKTQMMKKQQKVSSVYIKNVKTKVVRNCNELGEFRKISQVKRLFSTTFDKILLVNQFVKISGRKNFWHQSNGK